MKKHILWMIIGCSIPLLFIFLAPAVGLNDSVSLFIFIIAMFACHLLMPMHHPGGKKHSADTNNSKAETHESH